MATVLSGTTGEKCLLGGIYSCSIHTDHEITMDKDDIFPPCTLDDGHGATWNWQRSK